MTSATTARLDLVDPWPIRQVCVTAADDADGANANAGFPLTASRGNFRNKRYAQIPAGPLDC
jgi:hypothetical protein